jgi:hypothetical protein
MTKHEDRGIFKPRYTPRKRENFPETRRLLAGIARTHRAMP